MANENNLVDVVVTEANHVSTWARAVAARRIAIVGIVTIVLNLALAYGWITPNVDTSVLKWMNEALDALAALIAIALVHPVVTPSVDPRNDVGTPLVPVSQVKALVANAASQAAAARVDASDDEVVLLDETAPAKN